MDIVQMVLCGKVNKDLVTLLEKAGRRIVALAAWTAVCFRQSA